MIESSIWAGELYPKDYWYMPAYDGGVMDTHTLWQSPDSVSIHFLPVDEFLN